jgi:hypothetical protein
LENAYVEIMTSQRSFDMGPGLQPDCYSVKLPIPPM